MARPRSTGVPGRLDLTGDDVLLDVGCGTGAASRAAGPVAKCVCRGGPRPGDASDGRPSWRGPSRTFDSSSPTPSSFPSVTARSRPSFAPTRSTITPILSVRCERWVESLRAEAGSSSAMRARISAPRASPMPSSAGSSRVTSVSTARANWGRSCSERGLPRDASEALRWGVRDRAGHRGVNGFDPLPPTPARRSRAHRPLMRSVAAVCYLGAKGRQLRLLQCEGVRYGHRRSCSSPMRSYGRERRSGRRA